jgi:hypothetical protein
LLQHGRKGLCPPGHRPLPKRRCKCRFVVERPEQLSTGVPAGTTEHPGQGRDGGSPDRVDAIRAELAGAGSDALVTDDLWAQLWSKFLFVVPFGGLGTLFDLPLGELRTRPRTRQLLAACMEEIQRVAVAEGVPLPEDVVPATLSFVDQQPADVMSSLHRDTRAGGPSKLEAWAGAVVGRRARAGVATSLHDLLNEALAARARRRGSGSTRNVLVRYSWLRRRTVSPQPDLVRDAALQQQRIQGPTPRRQHVRVRPTPGNPGGRVLVRQQVRSAGEGLELPRVR